MNEELSKKLGNLYDDLPVGVLVVSKDDEERILYHNKQILDIMQCKNEEDFHRITHDHFSGLYHDEGEASIRRIFFTRHHSESSVIFLSFMTLTALGHARRLECVINRNREAYKNYWVLNIINSSDRNDQMTYSKVSELMTLSEFLKAALQKARDAKQAGQFERNVPLYFNLTNFHRYNEIYGSDQGDRLLNEVAYVIIEELPEAIIAHHSADNFMALADRHDLIKRIEKICHRVNNAIGENDIVLKVGIRPYEHEVSEEQVKRGFDEARIACISIEHNSEKMWAVYNLEIAKQEELKRYILTHFEEALKNHQIDVYFQPVVRSLNGRVCEVEALARWQDERYGMIMPRNFIPVLEENALITKLDTYIVELTAQILKERLDNHQKVVPVSFNFSQTDFGLCDVIDFLDSCVDHYHIPRNYLRVEINERGLNSENVQLTTVIEKLSQKSYHVAMDDFGKGYASLEVLRKYAFDEIKLDLSFMTEFDEEMQKILESLISLAKSLGIHTLAKGVETKAQKDLLVKIGCEKMQGYLYGQPMQSDAFLASCQGRQLLLETPLEAQLFDRAGLISLVGKSTAILRLYEGDIHALAMNDAYLDALKKAGIRNQEDNMRIRDKYNRDIVRFFMDAGKREEVSENTFSVNDVYLLLQVKKIAGPQGNEIFVAHLYVIAKRKDTAEDHNDLVKDFLDDSRHVFDGVYQFNYEKDECYVIKSSNSLIEKCVERQNVKNALTNIAQTVIYKDDRHRFLQFMQKDSILEKMKKSSKGELINYVRSHDEDGTYQWKACITVLNEKKDAVTFFVIEDFLHRLEDREETLHLYNAFYHIDDSDLYDQEREMKADMFDDLIAGLRDPIYWKDQELKYRGANLEFLKMHNLSSFAKIAGKTDEEIGWRLNEKKASEFELQVIQSGLPAYGVVSDVNANHRPHQLVETKLPYFSNGKAVGLISIITDQDNGSRLQAHKSSVHMYDEETGMQTYRGILEALEKGDWYCRSEGLDYSAMMMEVSDFGSYAKDYGSEIKSKLLKKIVDILESVFDRDTFYARIGECKFLFLTKQHDQSMLRERLMEAAKQIHEISEIDGCMMTLYLDYAMVHGLEVCGVDQLLTLLMERMKDAREDRLGEAVYMGDRIVFNLDQFEDMSERVAVIDPETYDVAYMNKMYLSDLHLPINYRYQGQKCYKLLYDRDSPCELCSNPQLSQDQFVSSVSRNLRSGTDYIQHSTFIPWNGKNYRFSLNINIGEYLQYDEENKRMLYNEVNANDAIRLAIEETDPEKGIQKIIGHIGKSLEAEGFFIFEENEDNTISCTYEWESDPNVSLKETLQDLPKGSLEHLYQQFEKNEVILIPNVGKYLLDHPDIQVRMKGLKRLISGYLKNSEKSYGFTEVVNPSPSSLKTAKELLSILTWFITLLLRNRDNMREMQRLSNEDQLTGVLNRRGFEEAIVNIPDGTHILAIFADINGLKRVNDTMGHKEGDALIVRAANSMISLFDHHHVFRMGGDEFLVYKEIKDDSEAIDYVKKLKEVSEQNTVSFAIGYTTLQAPVVDVNAFIREIDQKMYEDKGRHYHRRSTDR